MLIIINTKNIICKEPPYTRDVKVPIMQEKLEDLKGVFRSRKS